MITMVGHVFATRLLNDLHADEFGVLKICATCDVQRVIHRENNKPARWYWECLRCNDKEILVDKRANR